MSISVVLRNFAGMKKHLKSYLPLAAGVAVLMLWLWPWRHLTAAREGMQLFLWNTDYLWQHLTTVGGTACYIAELLVQFFVNPFYAALILALLFVLVQWLTARLLNDKLWLLSFLPPVLLCWLWTNLQVPLTPTVSVLMALAGLNILLRLSKRTAVVSVVIMFPVLYWMAGPSSAGDSYYWHREQVGSHEEMKYDLLLRQQRWSDIAALYAEKPSEQKAIRNAALLAQWQQGLISEEQLLGGLTLSNRTLLGVTSAFIMSEVSLQIGMVSISQRTAFEAMEAIPNGNKSARALRRLVETNILNGQTEVALKYISILEETLFYRSWAREMRHLAEHPESIGRYAHYQKLKDVFDNGKDKFFY